jgi:hypothetical protein
MPIPANFKIYLELAVENASKEQPASFCAAFVRRSEAVAVVKADRNKILIAVGLLRCDAASH